MSESCKLRQRRRRQQREIIIECTTGGIAISFMMAVVVSAWYLSEQAKVATASSAPSAASLVIVAPKPPDPPATEKHELNLIGAVHETTVDSEATVPPEAVADSSPPALAEFPRDYFLPPPPLFEVTLVPIDAIDAKPSEFYTALQTAQDAYDRKDFDEAWQKIQQADQLAITPEEKGKAAMWRRRIGSDKFSSF